MSEKRNPLRREVVMLRIDDIVDSWWNPNQETASKFNALFDSMLDMGFLENIQVVMICEDLLDAFDDADDKDHLKELMAQRYKWLVVQGSHRYQAAKIAGKEMFPEIPAIVLEPTDVDKLKALSVRMNIIKGEIDPDKFMDMWTKFADKGYSEQMRMDMMGVTSQRELQTLIKEMTRDLDPDLRREFEAHRSEIKSIEDLGRVLNELFGRFGRDLDFNFMTFVFGGKTHTFVRLNSVTSQLLAHVKEFCRQNAVDVNEVLAYGFRAVLGADEVTWPVARAEDLNIAE